MRIVFAGSPAVAVPTLAALVGSRHDIVGVVTRADSPQGRKKVVAPTDVGRYAAGAGLPLIKTDRLDDAATAAIAALEPDLGVIVAYGGLVREPLLSTPRLGWINLHFSLLPRWRGAAPVQHAILAGDSVTGVSVFRLVPELDAGELYAQVEEPIGRFHTNGQLLERLARIGAPVVVGVVDALEDGTALGRPQEGEVTLAGKLHAADGVIHWTRSAAEIDRLVRAVTPEPGASTRLDGERFKLLAAAPAHDTVRLAPGEVELYGRRVLVGTGDGLLELERVQPFGKSAMPAPDWFRGRRGERTVLGG